MSSRFSLCLAVAAGLALLPTSSAAAAGPGPGSRPEPGSGGAPTVVRSADRYYLDPDDLYEQYCGIETRTAVRESWTLKTWPDGSQSFHVERSFVPEDPRLPVERGAGTSYFSPDGTMTAIVGKPIQLIWPHAGVRSLDAGLTLVGDPTVHHGHLDVGLGVDDLAPYYCPAGG